MTENNVFEVTVSSSSYEQLPSGVYRVVLSDIIAEEAVFNEETKLQFRWVFEVADPANDYNGRKIVAWSSRNTSSKSKAFAWYTAIMGLPLDTATTGLTINLLDCIGIPVNVVVKEVDERSRLTELISIKQKLPEHLAAKVEHQRAQILKKEPVSKGEGDPFAVL